jgi:hypothetical protein
MEESQATLSKPKKSPKKKEHCYTGSEVAGQLSPAVLAHTHFETTLFEAICWWDWVILVYKPALNPSVKFDT